MVEIHDDDLIHFRDKNYTVNNYTIYPTECLTATLSELAYFVFDETDRCCNRSLSLPPGGGERENGIQSNAYLYIKILCLLGYHNFKQH